MHTLKIQESGQTPAPERQTPQHRLNPRSLAAMNAAREAVMHGRRFERDAADIVRSLREDRAARE